MQNSTTAPGAPDNAIEDLYPAILECFGIILLGYIAGRTKIIAPSNAKGLSNYITYFALPALVLEAMVKINFLKVNWLFWCSILISKAIVFALVYVASLIMSRKLDFGRAGIFAIFTVQSNDFALGYPIIRSIYKTQHPDFVNYLYLIAPISLAMLNPIGFFSMEIQRNRQARHRRSRLALLGHALKGLATNHVIIVVVLGIIGNFVFSQKLPQIIADFLNVLADSFSATALFFLGIGMVGKMKKVSSLFLLTPMLLIMSKLILFPLVTRQVVFLLNPGGNDTGLTESFSTYGFLYGTIPSAPTVYMFATLYQQHEEMIATAMVLCTFASAPMMFITATMVNLDVQNSAETESILSQAMIDVGCIGIACCVWILIVFILSKRYKLIPHQFTINLVLAQLLASIGIVLIRIKAGHSWFMIIKSAVILIGVFSTRCWATALACALCLLRCRSLCSVLRLKPLFYFYGWGVPTLVVALIIAVAKPVFVRKSQNIVFQYGDWQLIASVIVLGVNMLLVASALVILYKKDRYRHYYEEVDSRASNVESSEGEGETEKMLKNKHDDDSDQDRSLDIEDIRTTYETCSLAANCSESQRESCRRRTQLQHRKTVKVAEGTDLDPEDVVASHQLGRHTILLLCLLLSMIVGFSLCVWKLSGERQTSLYLMLEFLDTVLAYCQGFLTLAVFGFDTQNVIIPFYNALRRLLCKKTFGRSTTDEEDDLDAETRHIIQQFTQHHIETCKKDILKTVSQYNTIVSYNAAQYGQSGTSGPVKFFHSSEPGVPSYGTETSTEYERVGLQEGPTAFQGSDLVDWLVEVGLAVDRDNAVVYGDRLVRGGIIAHKDESHSGFHDHKALYEFHYEEDSESDSIQVVT